MRFAVQASQESMARLRMLAGAGVNTQRQVEYKGAACFPMAT